MIFDLSTKSSQYGDFQLFSTQDTSINLYCKSDVLDSGIIASWVVKNSQPKYIDDNNLIIDMDAFNECFKDDNDKDHDDDDDDDDDDNTGNNFWQGLAQDAVDGAIDAVEDITKNAVKLGRIMKLIDYIEEKMNSDENIDKNYTFINYNNYIKSYMGFKNLESNRGEIAKFCLNSIVYNTNQKNDKNTQYYQLNFGELENLDSE